MVRLALIRSVKKVINSLPCMRKYVPENVHCQPQYYEWKKNLNGKENLMCIAS